MEKKSIPASDEAWDERLLGADENFVGVVGADIANAIDEAAGSQLISIRIQKSTIEDLKLIASLNGIGYQTLMKQVMQRFVDCEKKQLFRELAAEKIGVKAALPSGTCIEERPVAPKPQQRKRAA